MGAFNAGGVLSAGSLGRRFPDQVLEQIPDPRPASYVDLMDLLYGCPDPILISNQCQPKK